MSLHLLVCSRRLERGIEGLVKVFLAHGWMASVFGSLKAIAELVHVDISHDFLHLLALMRPVVLPVFVGVGSQSIIKCLSVDCLLVHFCWLGVVLVVLALGSESI